MGPPGPLRSDGCPDMRYSCNRSWASSSGSSVPLTTGGYYSSSGGTSRGGTASGSSRSTSGYQQSSLQLRAVAENAPARLRADGLPDMRYSANKAYAAEKKLEVPLTTTSRRNSMASDRSKTSQSSECSGGAMSSASSNYSYSSYVPPSYYVPAPAPVSVPVKQEEPERVTPAYLEDRFRTLHLQLKVDNLERQLEEIKAKKPEPVPVAVQNEVVVNKPTISSAPVSSTRQEPAKSVSQPSAIQSTTSAASSGPISKVSVVEKKRISVESNSSVQFEIDMLNLRLNRIILETRAKMISRSSVVAITNNFNEPIGRGGFGQVFKGTWHKRQVAVKEIRPPWRCSTAKETRSFTKMIQREVEALSAVQHPNIIRLLGICTEADSQDVIGVSLIFDYANGGTLFDCLFGERSSSSGSALDASQMMLIAHSIIAALELLHSTDEEPGGSVMVHRDVKSANILLHRDEKGTVVRVVLADFGLARFHSDLNSSLEGATGFPTSSMTAVVGTHGYVDPLYAESSQVAPSQDIYAYGVILYEMLWRERPETLLARRARQSKLEDAIAKAEAANGFKETVKLALLVKIGKMCLGMENRPSSKEILTTLDTHFKPCST